MEQKLSLYDYTWERNKDIFDNSEGVKHFMFDVLKDSNVKHEGDCTNQNFSCSLCLVEMILESYYKYIKGINEIGE